MLNSANDSDDVFNRRLQAQESGNAQPNSGIDAQTPLMVDGRVSNRTCNHAFFVIGMFS